MTVSRERRLLLLVLGVALLLRLAHWAAVRQEPFVGSLVMDSQEYDRWAGEIAAGDWLGSEPFFQAPLYPYLLAVVYRVVGVGAALRLDAVYLVQIALALAGCFALYRAGRHLDGAPVGLAAAGLFALYGPFVFYDVQLLKESLAVSTVCFLLWALVAAATTGARRVWLATGVLAGILILLRENALLVLPFLLPVAWLGGRRRAASRIAVLAAGVAIVLAPVALRNAAVGGGFLPTTFQGGVNFYIGNNPQADGTYRPLTPGRQVPAFERREPVRLAELATGRELSAAEVSSYWLERSLDWAGSHPVDFLRLQLRKLRLFWRWYEWPDAVDYYYVASLSPVLGAPLLEFGGAVLLAVAGLWLIRRRLRDFSPVLLFLTGWVASTVIFFVFSRYRLPAVPALLVLGAVPVAGAFTAGVVVDLRSTALRLAVLAALVLPHLVAPGPRWDLVHYNLGLLAERQGSITTATEHFDRALEANPGFFSAALERGNLARRRGELASAAEWYRRAIEIEPGAAIAWSNLGGAALLAGDLEQARTALERAAEIEPRDPAVLTNLAVLAARLGERQVALERIEEILADHPGYPPALSLRERLESESGSPAPESP